MIVRPSGAGNGALGAGARPAGAVTVTVPGRLHLGFLDLNGGLGRRFGSIGIALEEPSTRLRLRAAERASASGPDAERARVVLERTAARLGVETPLALEVETAIPAHVGLGSGTQLALAAGVALCRLHGIEPQLRELGRLLGRGRRSGLGIGTFEAGGVVLDGGRGESEAPPPVLARLPFPDDWRILLVLDQGRAGLHGERETAALERLATFPGETAAHLCRLVLMRVLPALAEGDLARFGDGVGELQRILGDHFAPAQGGRFTSPAVARALAWLEAEGLSGVGQSSWGPTGFAIVGSPDQGERLARAARARFAGDGELEFRLVRGRNRGADVRVVHSPPGHPEQGT